MSATLVSCSGVSLPFKVSIAFFRFLGMTPALNHIIGETLCPREGLVRLRAWSSTRSAELSARLQPGRRHGADQRVGEVTPGIELI